VIDSYVQYAHDRANSASNERRRTGRSRMFEMDGDLFQIVRDFETGTKSPGKDTWRLMYGVHVVMCPCEECRPLAVTVDRALGRKVDDRPYAPPRIQWEEDGYIVIRPEDGSVTVAAKRFFGEVPAALEDGGLEDE